MYVILIISLIVFIIPIVITIVIRYEKKKTRELHEFANRFKFNFQEKGDSNLLNELSSFKLFSKGGSRKIRNVMDAQTKEAELMLMEYSYTIHNGKSSQRWLQTVIYFKSRLLKLPSFAMRPENIFHKIGSTMGYQDIDFESHPEFSKHFLLRGADEQTIRQVFNTRVLHYFNDKKGISLEGNENQLIYYLNSKRIKNESLKGFLDDGIQVFNLFSNEK